MLLDLMAVERAGGRKGAREERQSITTPVELRLFPMYADVNEFPTWSAVDYFTVQTCLLFFVYQYGRPVNRA
jgi:hypothetical protein